LLLSQHGAHVPPLLLSFEPTPFDRFQAILYTCLLLLNVLAPLLSSCARLPLLVFVSHVLDVLLAQTLILLALASSLACHPPTFYRHLYPCLYLSRHVQDRW